MSDRYLRLLPVLFGLVLLLPASAFGQNESVFGNLCVGTSCTSGEIFGTDVLKVKDLNVRLFFDDTSTSGGFPSNDWRLTVNSDINGGPSFLSLDDATAGTVPFLIEATAQTDALVISDFDGSGDSGYIGIGTDNPAMEVHVFHGGTPGIRLEQDGTQGFGTYAWDIAGNEANFFVRDVTGSNVIPFRIYPGASAGAMTIATNNRVGIGTVTPTNTLHIQANNPTLRVQSLTTGVDPLRLDENGNLTLAGVLTEASSMHLKENRKAVNSAEVLEKLRSLPVETWNYRTDDDGVRHMGPMAQTFYAAFGLGVDDEHLAPLDANGVALASIQALLDRVERLENEAIDTEQAVERLRQENDALSQRLEQLEHMVKDLHSHRQAQPGDRE